MKKYSRRLLCKETNCMLWLRIGHKLRSTLTMVVIYTPVPQQYIKFLIFSVRNFSWKILCHAIIYLPVRLNISNALECKLLQNLALKFRYGIYKQLIISPYVIYFKKNSAASQHNVVNPSNKVQKASN
jgi:hypothetical protein